MTEMCEKQPLEEPAVTKKKEHDEAHAHALRLLFDQAMNRLAQREYGEEELRRKLRAYTDNKEDVEIVLKQIKQAGQLSDERFVETYVQSRVRRGFGPIRICAELAEKGITKDTINQILSMWKTSWVTVAKRVLEKKYRNTLKTDKKALMLTQKRFLLYRGFEPMVIQQALTELHAL